jgi:predicted enzyme related to lactoylglutathione lyase
MNQPPRENQIDFIEWPAASEATLQRAKEFYAAVFGWEFQDWGGDYSDTKSSGVGSGINADPSHRSRSSLVVIYSSDLVAARTRVLAAGGKISKAIFSFPGGNRFHYLDPAGNELGVWSDKS